VFKLLILLVLSQTYRISWVEHPGRNEIYFHIFWNTFLRVSSVTPARIMCVYRHLYVMSDYGAFTCVFMCL